MTAATWAASRTRQIRRLYELNPTWAEIERRVYGGPLGRIGASRRRPGLLSAPVTGFRSRIGVPVQRLEVPNAEPGAVDVEDPDAMKSDRIGPIWGAGCRTRPAPDSRDRRVGSCVGPRGTIGAATSGRRPRRRPAGPSRPGANRSSNTRHASGAPSSPCLGAAARSTRGDSTVPIAMSSMPVTRGLRANAHTWTGSLGSSRSECQRRYKGQWSKIALHAGAIAHESTESTSKPARSSSVRRPRGVNRQ